MRCWCGHDELSHRIVVYDSKPACTGCFPKAMALHTFEVDETETRVAVPPPDYASPGARQGEPK